MQLFLIRLTVAVLLSVAIFVQFTESAALFDQDSAHFKAQQKSCSDLCGFCPSCNGFYCGEECICECRQDANDHVQCISKIKENSDKMGLLYDVLIQLPKSKSRQVRSASPSKKITIDDEATFRKVLELIQLPMHLTKTPLQRWTGRGKRRNPGARRISLELNH
ncbi:uncharacterized protein LOC129725155 isoform X2 [Wyeomyia smithii]|uniref:uncharacterized protein LOC129725155 isoform X2 n=1 Tax=Wyeomyia smithii TaxID=174621 RepID=UPI002467C222|nr:uncharacterized protein LOC129725155 isoform X2 [Wyeomyia smithii]